jgi:GTP1/Obg family GTP-binding protein
MDLIKQMVQRRQQLGITAEKSVPAETPAQRVKVAEAPKSLRQRRRDIIENKPKSKVLKEYFEDLIAEHCEDSSDEDD